MTRVPENGIRLPRNARRACAAAVLLAGLVYVNALDNPFVYDDHRLILENQSLTDPTNLRGLLLRDATRPVINISYAIDRTLWGPEPFGFHLTNVLLHMANVGLLFLLVWQMTGRRATGTEKQTIVAPLVAASILAVHPLMTQAVGYVASRSEVLCATWLLLALLAARRWMRGAGMRWLAITAALWVLALGTKEIAAMFPFILVLYDRLVYPGDRAERQRRLWQMHLPFVGVAILAAAVRVAVFAMVEHVAVKPVWWLGLVELDVFRQYVALLLMPNGQSIFHAVSAVSGPLDPGVAVGLVLVAVMLAASWQLRKTHGVVGLGLLWFLLLLVPSTALVILDRGEPMAEHRVYAASIGFFIAVGAVAATVSHAVAARSVRLHRVLGVVLAIWIVTLAGRTVLRNAIWHDPLVVWTEAMQRAPDHWLPQLALGEELQRAGRCDEAVPRFRASLQLYPEEPTGYPKLGACLLVLNRLDEADAVFEALRQRDPWSPHATNGLGAVALARGQMIVARRHFQNTLDRDPHNAQARHGLGLADAGTVTR